MKADNHPLVLEYLAAVEREAMVLPADRRSELLADLAEHIAVSEAEGFPRDADGVRALLHQLGDPRTIVATALGEEPASASAPPRGLDRPAAAIAALAASSLLWVVASPLAGVVWLVGLTLLWRAPYWTKRQKQVTTAATVLVPAVYFLWLLGIVSAGGLGPMEVLLALALVVAAPVVMAVALFKAARRQLA
ncbi:hypothetical protein [Streptomyces sp. NBC_01565]|uniref:HAAS signaling domain-containing protein n=1 Tax=unclassified Streptomyces TaxID=2593676 RepID=UPI002254C9EC|nr:hypothetical protein [Streptomyces sp. NBC_01565]MCX4539297.1 hypothetical protein [Streptomyces sp. NBC_01565]